MGIFADVVSAVQAPVYDFSEANVRALNQRGYEAHCLPIEGLDHNARDSVISMADVLEQHAVSECGTCRRAPAAASGWRAFSLDGGHGQHGLAAAARQWCQSPLGRDPGTTTIFPASAFTRSCNTMFSTGRISHHRTLPRLPRGDPGQAGVRGRRQSRRNIAIFRGFSRMGLCNRRNFR